MNKQEKYLEQLIETTEKLIEKLTSQSMSFYERWDPEYWPWDRDNLCTFDRGYGNPIPFRKNAMIIQGDKGYEFFSPMLHPFPQILMVEPIVSEKDMYNFHGKVNGSYKFYSGKFHGYKLIDIIQ